VEACDRLVGSCVRWITRNASPFSPPLVFMPLHKGADSFMNDEQYRRFYWPSFRKVMLGLIDEGFVPYLFAEGGYNKRLEVIADLPRGRTVWHFDRTDMRRAKQVLGGTSCIQGNVPVTLLQMGSVDEVSDYCKDLIQDVAPGGGFILDVGATVDTAKPENMMAMRQSVER
jgi:uroporphyrinogen-III decarboxylase